MKNKRNVGKSWDRGSLGDGKLYRGTPGDRVVMSDRTYVVDPRGTFRRVEGAGGYASA